MTKKLNTCNYLYGRLNQKNEHTFPCYMREIKHANIHYSKVNILMFNILYYKNKNVIINYHHI